MSAERLRDLVHPTVLARDQVLPVLPGLEALFPAGLRQGSTVTVTAGGHQGTTTLALGLAAAPSASGSWCAVVGIPDLGLAAAAETGVRLERLALVPSVPPDQWTTTVGALLDAVDLVIAQPPPHLRLGDARRLTARARERRSVLVPLLAAGRTGPWADGADVRLAVSACRWEGPGAGEGRVVARRVTVTVGGRGAAARPLQVELWLPGPGGTIVPVAPATAYAGADIDRFPDVTAAFRSAG